MKTLFILIALMSAGEAWGSTFQTIVGRDMTGCTDARTGRSCVKDKPKPKPILPPVDSSGEWNRSPPLDDCVVKMCNTESPRSILMNQPVPATIVTNDLVHEKLDKILKLLEEQKLPECDQIKSISKNLLEFYLFPDQEGCIARRPK